MIKRIVVYTLSFFWMLVLVVWPSETNVAPVGPIMRDGASKEGLYKADLTRANFGMLGFRLYETSNGKKHWHIRSKFAELHRKDNHTFMRGVNANFFAQKTGNTVRAFSDFGKSNLQTRDVEMEGNVLIRSRLGYLFRMSKLFYEGDTNEFNSKNLVRMKGPDVDNPKMFLRGVGMLAHIDDEHFLLDRDVRARRRLATDEWLYVNSKSGEFFADEQRAIFTGEVQSKLPDMLINSDVFELKIEADREFLYARGNVVLETDKRTGTAERAFLEVGTDKVILEGGAKIDSQKNKIQGRRIILYTEEDRVEVEAAEGSLRDGT